MVASMDLYYSKTSPFARKVQVVLLEKGLPFYGIDVRSSGRSPSERNPLGKVPTLILDDGLVLFDSTVITETLESLQKRALEAERRRLSPEPALTMEHGRPTKRDRRDLQKDWNARWSASADQ